MSAEDRGTTREPLRLLRWVAIALAVVAAGVLAAGLALSWGWRRDALRSALEGALSRAIGATVRIGALEGRLYPELLLRDLELSTSRGRMLSIDALQAHVLLRPLVTRGTLVIETLRVDGPSLLLERDAQGWSFEQLATRGEPERSSGTAGLFSPAVELRVLRVERGTFEILAAGPRESSAVTGQFELSADGIGISPAGKIAGPSRAEMSLGFDPSRVAGRELRSAALRLALAGGELEIREARLDSAFGSARIEGRGALAIFAERTRAASAGLSASFQGLDLGLLTGRPELASAATGTIELAATRAAGVPPLESDVTVALRLEPSRIAATGQTTLDLEGSYHTGRWQIGAARVESEIGALEIEGNGDLEGMEQVRAHAELRDLAAVDRLLPATLGLEGRTVVDARLRGAWRDAQAEVELEGADVLLRGVDLGDVHAAFATRGTEELWVRTLSLDRPGIRLLDETGARVVRDASGIQVSGLRLAQGAGRLALSGRIEPSALRNVQVEAENLDVEALAALAGSSRRVAGRVTARLSLDGALPLPRVDGSGTWEAPRFGDASAERLRFEASTAQGRIRGTLRLEEAERELLLARADLPYAASALDLRALLGSPDARLELVADELFLGDVMSVLPLDVRDATGRARIRLALRGARPLPVVEGEVSLAQARVVLSDGQSVGPVDGRLRLTPEAIEAQELRLATESGPILLDASVRIAPLGPEALQLRIARLSVESPWLRAASDGDAVLAIDTRGVSIEQLRLVDGAQSVSLRGRIERDALRELRVETASLELEALSRLAGVAPAYGGSATASFVLDGPFARPAVVGRASIASPSYGTARADRLGIELDADGALARGAAHLEVEGREALSARATLRYVGSSLEAADILASSETELEVRTEDFELAWIEPLAPASLRRLGGRVRGNLHVRGARPEPSVDGEIEIEEGSFQLPAFARTVSAVSGRAHIASRAIQIDYLRIGSEERGASVEGRVELDAGLPSAVDLVARLKQFQLGAGRALRAQLDGQVSVQGPILAMVARGRVDVSEARVTLPEPDDRLMREVRVLRLAEGGVPVEATGPTTGVFDRASLDLTVAVPENTWIVGRGASLEVAGDLRLVKEPLGEPRYLGALQVVRGQWRLHGRTFKIQQGVAAFTGTAELDPEVHVLALHRVRDITIVAMISGRASAPEVSLTSNPTMDQTDVLSYLLFGRRARDLGETESVGLQKTAALALGGVATSRLTEALREFLPVDAVDIELVDGGGGAAVGVGRYITPDVFVRYGQSFGGESQGDVDVEWRVNRVWSVESGVTTSGTAGVDLIWHLDY